MTIKILEHLYYFGFSNGILEKKHKKIVVRPDKNLEMYIKNIKKNENSENRPKHL